MGDELGRKAWAKVVGDQDAVMGDRLWRSAWNTSWVQGDTNKFWLGSNLEMRSRGTIEFQRSAHLEK